MTHTLIHTRPLPRRSRFSLSDFLTLARQRRALARMDDAQLRDIGVTQADAQAEAMRPVWDVPTHWKW